MASGLFFRKLFFWIFVSIVCASYVSAEEKIPSPYILPQNHPIKEYLDALFSSSRVILNLDTLKEAGFTYSKPRRFTNLIIAKHPLLPGYIFKLYLDAQRYHKDQPEHHFWKLRIEGATKVRHVVEVHGLQNWIKVPQKWIYILPKQPAPRQGYMTKQTILVEEDMDLVSPEENESLWSSGFVTHSHLDAIYIVLKIVGLSDCAKPDNMPFSHDGRIAFIDTQTHDQKVPFKQLASWLSKENQTYWKQIISQ